MKYAFIEEHRAFWPLWAMLRALGVAKSGYFAWRHPSESPRAIEDRSLTARIRVIHAGGRQTYGSPRVYQQLKAEGITVGRKRVERLMRSAGIRVTPPRRFVVTTDSTHDLPVAPDLLQQDFSAPAPDQRWVTDITYIPTHAGWLYLAAVMDLYSRRIVGWAMQGDLSTSLVLRALDMAVTTRQPRPGLIHHSDRGSQYASLAYRNALSDQGILPSMSRRACCYDNAAMESFFHTLKMDMVHRHDFRTHQQAKSAIFEYIEVFYNRIRLHSTIGYSSPVAFEQQLLKVA